MGSNPITDYLQRMFNRRIAGQYTGPGPSSPEDVGAGSASTPAGPSSPSPWAPWVKQLPDTLGAIGGAMAGGNFNPAGPLPFVPGPSMNPRPMGPPVGKGTPALPKNPADLQQPSWPQYGTERGNPTLGPSTKLDQHGPLAFAWSGGALQSYDPSKSGGINPTPELTSQLAQSRAQGFMGQPGSVSFPTPTNGGTPGPGFSPSQTDWSKVANPMAFSGYTEQPERADIERYLQDPMWREKQSAQIEQNKQVAIVQAQAAAQASQIQQQAEITAGRVKELAEHWIAQKNDQLQKEGKPPLDAQGQNTYYQMAQQRVSGKYGLV